MFALCRLLVVVVAVSLADRDTFADKSTRELVQNHCSDPLIPRSVFNPLASSLVVPFILYNVGVG